MLTRPAEARLEIATAKFALLELNRLPKLQGALDLDLRKWKKCSLVPELRVAASSVESVHQDHGQANDFDSPKIYEQLTVVDYL